MQRSGRVEVVGNEKFSNANRTEVFKLEFLNQSRMFKSKVASWWVGKSVTWYTRLNIAVPVLKVWDEYKQGY